MNFLEWLNDTPGPARSGDDTTDVVMFFVPRRDFDQLQAAAERRGLSPQQALSQAVALFLERERQG